MQDHPFSRQVRNRRALSLVELLVMIAVIAVITAIAIPMLTNVFQRSQDSAARRNAQAIAGVASSASAAGSTAIAAAVDKEAAVTLLTEGITGEGQFAENVFMVNLKAEERERTMKYLVFQDGTLEFNPISE